MRPFTALTAVERLAVSSSEPTWVAASLPVCRSITCAWAEALRVPEVLGDDVAHAGDLGELVAHLRNREVEVLRADEEDVVGLALPDRAQQPRDQLDQAARLLELLVLLEQGDDVLQARMERIGGGDLVGDGFGAAIGDLGLCWLPPACGHRLAAMSPISALSGRDLNRRLRRMS